MHWVRARPRRWVLLVVGALGVVLTLAFLVVGSRTNAPAGAAQPTPVAGPDGAPTVTFVGDSWTAGAGATGRHGYAYLTGEQLRWNHSVLGIGGTGYTAGGEGRTFDSRIDAAVATGADVLVVQGSLNDRKATPAAEARAALETLTRLRAEADPATVILVLGASHVPERPDAPIDRVNDAVREAAAEVGLTFVDVAAENWTDPADPAIWADGIHPNDAGHQLVADRLAPLLRATLAH